MMKLGVYRPSQFAEHTAKSRVLPRRTRLAYTLLRTSLPPSPEEIERFEYIMRHVHLSGGVYRTTAGGRFQTLDAFLAPLLQKHFGGAAGPLRIEDWAASACITSVEWFQNLTDLFPGVQLTASDLHLYLVEVVLPNGASYIVEAEGQPIQYVKPPFVIPMNRTEPALLPLNRWLQSQAQRTFQKLEQQGLAAAIRQGSDRDEWKQGDLLFRKIPLVHPRALALQQSNPAFRVENHSVFEARPGLCDVIRTMNILNLSYFSQEQLMEGVRTVWKSLQPGGVWMVGRTIEEQTEQAPAVHHASVFQKTPDGFRLMARHGSPSEIEDLALACRM